MSTTAVKFWLGTVSKEHVLRAVAGGFCQVCHGKAAPLNRMRRGDWLLYYSPKISLQGREKLQSFKFWTRWPTPSA